MRFGGPLFLLKYSAIRLLFDLGAAYALHRWLNPEEPYGWLWILVGIWLISAVAGARRTLYKIATAFISQRDLTELYRQKMVEAKVPPPPRFNQQAAPYLLDVADDPENSDSVRFGAFGIAAELNITGQTSGLITGLAVQKAANAALDKIKH